MRHLFHSSIKECFLSSYPYPTGHANMYKKKGKKCLIIHYFGSLLVIGFLKYIIKLPSHPWLGDQGYCKTRTSKSKRVLGIWHSLSFHRIHNISENISRKASTLYMEKGRGRRGGGRKRGIFLQNLIYPALKGFFLVVSTWFSALSSIVGE